MRLLRKGLLFTAGGAGYVLLELLWRGRSHGSMFLAGGGCFMLLGKLAGKGLRLPLWLRAVLGSAVITAVELATGFLFNRQYRVWDYREIPGNFRGQICLPFSLLWMPLSLVAMALYTGLDRILKRRGIDGEGNLRYNEPTERKEQAL